MHLYVIRIPGCVYGGVDGCCSALYKVYGDAPLARGIFSALLVFLRALIGILLGPIFTSSYINSGVRN